MGQRMRMVAIIWFLALISYGISVLEHQALSVTDFPPCTLECLIPAIPKSGCAIDDLNCTCNNKYLTESLGQCILEKCRLADIQKTARVQAALCNLSNESRRHGIFIIAVVSYVIIGVSVVLRISGNYMANRLGKDDLCVVFAYTIIIAAMWVTFTMLNVGLGRHVWSLDDGALLSFLRLFYIAAIFYIALLGMLKIAVVLFYLQIFQSTYARFRIIAHILLVYITINTLVLVLITIFGCIPLGSFWNRDIKGKCLDLPAIGYAVGVSAIIQDVILLIMPLASLRKMTMERSRKIAAGILLSIGTLGCVATILRFRTHSSIKVSSDPTWDYASAEIYAHAELCSLFLCISLPGIRLLIVRVFPGSAKTFLRKFRFRSSNNALRRSARPTPQAQGSPKGFFSRIMPTGSTWSKLTASSGASTGLSSAETESTANITRMSGDANHQEEFELQDVFQLDRQHWQKHSDKV